MNSSGENSFISSSTTDSEAVWTHDSETSGSKPVKVHIFLGCPHTQVSSCVTLMLLATKHKIANELFADILLTISSYLPKPNKFIKSVYLTKEFLKAHMPLKKATKKYVCRSCGAYLNDTETCNKDVCQQNSSKSLEFFDLNLEHQIQELFKGGFGYYYLHQYNEPILIIYLLMICNYNSLQMIL